MTAVAYLGVVSALKHCDAGSCCAGSALGTNGRIPAIAAGNWFWLGHPVDYSVLLFVAGSAVCSLLRRSFGFGVLAAIVGNRRFVSVAGSELPVSAASTASLSVALALLAAYLNEEDFTEDQMASVRYLALGQSMLLQLGYFIMVSCKPPWLNFAAGGVLSAGVWHSLFGSRAKVVGRCISLLATLMIWCLGQPGLTWLWYVQVSSPAPQSFSFAVFEKKRGEVLRWLRIEGLGSIASHS